MNVNPTILMRNSAENLLGIKEKKQHKNKQQTFNNKAGSNLNQTKLNSKNLTIVSKLWAFNSILKTIYLIIII